MSAPISVVIPTLNAVEEIGPCLAQLVRGVEAGLIGELVLSDGGSTDEIAKVAEELGAKLVCGARGRGGQLRRGAAAAKGDWLLFLHADTQLPDGWLEVIERHMSRGPEQAAVFRLRFDDPSFIATWVSGWANWRTRLFGLPYGDQGMLISRALYRAIGEYPDIPLMEDVALARALGRRRIHLLPAYATTSAVRYHKEGWLRRGARNWACLGLYFLGVSPERIARIYR